MSTTTADVFVSGGGIAGLAAACAFGAAGFRVVCTEPAAPVTAGDDEGADLRTTALLQPSVRVLEAAGLWSRIAPDAAPLQVMRIVDAGGPFPEPRLVKDFDAADISDQPFGWNVPNWILRRALVARLADLPGVDFRPGIATTGVLTREREARVTLSDGSRVTARLVVAADGRASVVRQALGIGVRTFRYGQKAMAFAVTHPVPHQNVSTEIHRSGGPFTLVPLPDRDGRPASAVVWMETAAAADRLAALPVAEFEAAMTERSCHILGPLTLASRRSLWPIISQLADRMAGERCALMAEAAHVMPPIGAQGLNMSLADLRVLIDLAASDRDGLGSAAMLDRYHRTRHWEVQARVLGVDALNRASMVATPSLRDLRALALDTLYSLSPLRRTLMRAGLGLR